ncbi:MAG: hypothetical protein HQL95_04380 [Magnetococcales bacterium]|nr:hypothetical protein [Magnetococcales bacterium]
MALQQAEIDQIITQLKPQITVWLAERDQRQYAFLNEKEMVDRFVRVEEGLKYMREWIQHGTELTRIQCSGMQKRIELLETQIRRLEDKHPSMQAS